MSALYLGKKVNSPAIFSKMYVTWADSPLPPAPRGVCTRWALGGKGARSGKREMAGKVFAGSWIRSQESRIPLVSSVQVPESKILIQEEQASVRPTSPPVSFWLAAFSLHFSTLSQSLSFRQRSFTRLPYHFLSLFLFRTPSLRIVSHKKSWISNQLTIFDQNSFVQH